MWVLLLEISSAIPGTESSDSGRDRRWHRDLCAHGPDPRKPEASAGAWHPPAAARTAVSIGVSAGLRCFICDLCFIHAGPAARFDRLPVGFIPPETTESHHLDGRRNLVSILRSHPVHDRRHVLPGA